MFKPLLTGLNSSRRLVAVLAFVLASGIMFVQSVQPFRLVNANWLLSWRALRFFGQALASCCWAMSKILLLIAALAAFVRVVLFVELWCLYRRRSQFVRGRAGLGTAEFLAKLDQHSPEEAKLILLLREWVASLSRMVPEMIAPADYNREVQVIMDCNGDYPRRAFLAHLEREGYHLTVTRAQALKMLPPFRNSFLDLGERTRFGPWALRFCRALLPLVEKRRVAIPEFENDLRAD